MVTLPTEAASDYMLVRHLVASGMDIACIKLCAWTHDTNRPSGSRWQPMCARLRQRSVAPVGSPWTGEVRNCERVH